MTQKRQLLFCIFMIILMLTGCKIKKKVLESTATTETSEPTVVQTLPESESAETEPKQYLKDMELPDEEDTLTDSTDSSMVEAPAQTHPTQAPATSIIPDTTEAPVVPQVTEAPIFPESTEPVPQVPGPYGNGANGTPDDEL